MYKIIGANQVEYGPITADQLRTWIVEGRVNGQTPVQTEGDTTWRPLATFPEFAASLPPALTMAAPVGAPPTFGASVSDDGGRARAASMVMGPAIALIITGGLGIGYAIFSILQYFLVGSTMRMAHNFPGQSPEMEHFSEVMGGVVGVGYCVLAIILWILVIFGAVNMKKLQKHGFSIAASIIAMTPCVCPCCVFGLPFGIWALVVLSKAEVKQHFT